MAEQEGSEVQRTLDHYVDDLEERVARAIAEFDWSVTDPDKQTYLDQAWPRWVDVARAAIAELQKWQGENPPREREAMAYLAGHVEGQQFFLDGLRAGWDLFRPQWRPISEAPRDAVEWGANDAYALAYGPWLLVLALGVPFQARWCVYTAKTDRYKPYEGTGWHFADPYPLEEPIDPPPWLPLPAHRRTGDE